MKVNSHLFTEIVRHNSGSVSVTFKDGSKYRFDNLPAEVATEWVGAESVGSFFLKNVRGKFEGAKVRAAVKKG